MAGKGSTEVYARLPVNEEETFCVLAVGVKYHDEARAYVANGGGITKQCIISLNYTFARDQASIDNTMVR